MNSSNKTAVIACLALLAVAGYAIPKMVSNRADTSGADMAELSPAAGPVHEMVSKDPVATAIKEAKGKADVAVVKAWGKPAMGKMGAAFLTLENKGQGNAILISAESPVAKRVEFHTHIMDAGIARMRPIGQVVVPAGQTVEMKSGGLHVMLFDLKQPLPAGQSFPLILKFHDGKTLQTDVQVQADTATDAATTEAPAPAAAEAVASPQEAAAAPVVDNGGVATSATAVPAATTVEPAPMAPAAKN
jgi:copper(I)-binding protein